MLRYTALKNSLKDKKHPKVSKHIEFNKNVLTFQKLRNLLDKPNYKKLSLVCSNNETIDKELADRVANAMREWALSRGATHYTHWFQPLTGLTAEKHDSFFEIESENQEPISHLDGLKLVQQEPDASSFPTGGLRNTFEARGYTAWDPSSPAFLVGNTLCIPSVFVSYRGESLDFKTPLLRSIDALSKAASAVASLFYPNVNAVSCMLGWEQEYFLVDEGLATARPDLRIAGRTLVGKTSTKRSSYFGAIPRRVLNFMEDVEGRAAQLGIPIKTRHNEVAPNQYEFAHIHENLNTAVDHNSLFMEILRSTAQNHGFRALLHEKPFSGVNGSGKHCNWSLVTDTGVNLLEPSTNLAFVTFLIITIRAVYRNQELIRASVASYSNDVRLGGHEAPPSVISIFIGDALQKTLENWFGSEAPSRFLKIIARLPCVRLDSTDRNRTSPFAFTGNKFEFRSVGSSVNCARAMTAICAAVSDELTNFINDLRKETLNCSRVSVSSVGNDNSRVNEESSDTNLTKVLGDLRKVLGDLGNQDNQSNLDNQSNSYNESILDNQSIRDNQSIMNNKSIMNNESIMDNESIKDNQSNRNNMTNRDISNESKESIELYKEISNDSKIIKDIYESNTNISKFKNAIVSVLKRYYEESKNIIFNGDGYSQKWLLESERRGLRNYKSTADILRALHNGHHLEAYIRTNIMTTEELNSRLIIDSEEYVNSLKTETSTLIDMAMTQIIPAAVKYRNRLLKNLNYVEQVNNAELRKLSDKVGYLINSLLAGCDRLGIAISDVSDLRDLGGVKKALEIMGEIRGVVDELEGMVDDALWPFPKYWEMFYSND